MVGDTPLAGAPTKTDAEGIVRIEDKTPDELAGIQIRFPERYDLEWKHLRFEDPKTPVKEDKTSD